MVTIDKETKIRIGVLITILGIAVWGYDRLMADRFTLPMACEQAMRHAMANPGVRVPDPRSPDRYFQIEKARLVTSPDLNSSKGQP